MGTQSLLLRKVVMSAVSVGKAATAYSDGFAFDGSEGDCAILIASTAGSITVTQQCSIDGVTYHDAVSSAGAALGAVAAALTVTTGTYIAYAPVLAPYVRFKVVEGNVAATVVTLTVAFRVQRRG